MFIVAGAPAHSSFKQTQLLTRLSSISYVQSIESQWVYLFDQALDEQQQQSALQLLNDGATFQVREATSDEVQVLVTPRVGTISPWSSKATDIFANCNTPIHRLERGVLFTLKGISEVSDAVKQVLRFIICFGYGFCFNIIGLIVYHLVKKDESGLAKVILLGSLTSITLLMFLIVSKILM